MLATDLGVDVSVVMQVQATCTNTAGLSSSALSPRLLIDDSPPTFNEGGLTYVAAPLPELRDSFSYFTETSVGLRWNLSTFIADAESGVSSATLHVTSRPRGLTDLKIDLFSQKLLQQWVSTVDSRDPNL